LVGASLLGADLTGISYNNETDFTGAFYDTDTRFDLSFDTTGLILVPEPSTAALLTFGLTLLAFRRVSWRSHRRLRALTPPQGI
ncbi:MAG: PEP-CTERM sorting domain-containing protein, partial [Deltaproteobacteria bacterium]|nr:PEP-CTERM sorting domain-containing protein [Deltaproteobacteria bacterium]